MQSVALDMDRVQACKPIVEGPTPTVVSRRQSRLGVDITARTQKTGLIIPAGVSLEAWTNVGQSLHRISDSSSWWLGDWLLYGEKNYPGRYREAVEKTGLDYQTLRNYAWVARAFEPSRRRDKLSFQHHAEVAAQSPEQQTVWLIRALQFGWSRRRLREELRGTRKETKIDAAKGKIDFQVSIAEEQHRRWLDAAAREDLSLSTWIADTLDEAARRASDHREP